jgi:hypothetical protein
MLHGRSVYRGVQPEGPNPAMRRSEYEAAVAVMTQLIASLRGGPVSTATSAARATTVAAAAAAAVARDARQYTSSQQCCSSNDQLTRQWSDVSDYASVAELSAVRAPKSVRATQPFSHRAHATSSSSEHLHDGCSGSVATGTAAAADAQFCASDATAVRKGHTRAVIEGSSVAAAGSSSSVAGQWICIYIYTGSVTCCSISTCAPSYQQDSYGCDIKYSSCLTPHPITSWFCH